MEGSGDAKARVMATVKRLKGVLDNSSVSSRDEILGALDQLQSLGSLSTDILKETLVGLSPVFSIFVPWHRFTLIFQANLYMGWPNWWKIPKSKAKRKVWSWLGGTTVLLLHDGWGTDICRHGRQDFKKRKASTDELQLRRMDSNVSEGTSASQDLGLSLASRSFSQDFDVEATRATVEAEARPLERATSSLSVASASQGETKEAKEAKKDDAFRDKVRAKLVEALGKEEELEARGGETTLTSQSTRDPVALAQEIEEELIKALPKKEAYMNQARSILFNLKDTKNPTFRFKLMVGFFQPAQLPTLTAEEMASEQKKDERRKQRQYAMEALDQGWALKNGQQPTTGMFTCGKCKGNKTTYFQMQTRSSDEPMTTFVTCLTCGNRWKFC
eukprot:symbB.v1.2.030064.t1/scaffold3340.1/size58798/3